MFLHGIPLDRIKFAGGWASLTTLEHYVQEASAYRAFASLGPTSAALLGVLRCSFPSVPPPPQTPWADIVLEHGATSAAGLPESLGIEPDLIVWTVRLAHAEVAPRPTEVLASLTGADADELASDSSVARVRLWLRREGGELVSALGVVGDEAQVAA